jgi:hypothetical protein
VHGKREKSMNARRRERGQSALPWILVIALVGLLIFFIGRASMVEETPEEAVRTGVEATGETLEEGAADAAGAVEEGAEELERSLED